MSLKQLANQPELIRKLKAVIAEAIITRLFSLVAYGITGAKPDKGIRYVKLH